MVLCGIEIMSEVVVEIEEINSNRVRGLDSIHKGSQKNSGIK